MILLDRAVKKNTYKETPCWLKHLQILSFIPVTDFEMVLNGNTGIKENLNILVMLHQKF